MLSEIYFTNKSRTVYQQTRHTSEETELYKNKISQKRKVVNDGWNVWSKGISAVNSTTQWWHIQTTHNTKHKQDVFSPKNFLKLNILSVKQTHFLFFFFCFYFHFFHLRTEQFLSFLLSKQCWGSKYQKHHMQDLLRMDMKCKTFNYLSIVLFYLSHFIEDNIWLQASLF